MGLSSVKALAGHRRSVLKGLVIATLAAALAFAAVPAAGASSHPGHRPVPPRVDYRRVCPAAGVGRATCLALIRTDVRPHRQLADRPDTGPVGDGYGPADLQRAYNLPAFPAGEGQTVAVVDPYDDPNIAADLATYRSAWGLLPCGAGCFSKVNEIGNSSPLPAAATSGWDIEESLDVDMISAACPACHILLVEADSTSLTDLGTAVNSAVSLGASFVSNSYGGPESSADPGYDSTYFNHPGVVVTAAAGDNGFGVIYPAASQYVMSVGGTSLISASNVRGFTETAWSGTGSGCSVYDPKPSWQTDTGCSGRTDNDIAAVADPATGLAVYDTYAGRGGWFEAGGTSAAAPIVASAYALAGSPAPGSYPASDPYSDPSHLFDITSGSNGTCSPAYLCTAGAGYDGSTGEGTPDIAPPPQFQEIPTAVGENRSGRLQVFGSDTSGAIWQAAQTDPVSDGWTVWSDLGGTLAGAPSVGANSDGRLEIFDIASNGHIYHAWQTTPGGTWTGWSSLGAPGGGLATTATVGQNSDGQA